MKVYYSHCKAIYNTPQERDLDLLKSLGFNDILNNMIKLGRQKSIA